MDQYAVLKNLAATLPFHPWGGQALLQVVPCAYWCCSKILQPPLITSSVLYKPLHSSLTRADGEVSGREVGAVHGDIAVHAQLSQGSS